MNINDAFPSQYLKASDLNGSQPVVTIARVEIEPVGRSKDMKPIAYFAGKDKGLVLNKTNSKKIAEIAGTAETDDWAGTRIRLYATEVDFQGDQVEAIRVKAPGSSVKATVKPAAPPADDDLDVSDVPF